MMNVFMNGVLVGVCSDIQPDYHIGYMFLSKKALDRAGVNWSKGPIAWVRLPFALATEETPHSRENLITEYSQASYKDDCILVENVRFRPSMQ